MAWKKILLDGDAGGGATIKAGTITTDVNGAASISFNTSFSNTNYAILLSCANPGDTTLAMWSSKAVGGFSVVTEDDGGKAEPSVVVDWLATAYANP